MPYRINTPHLGKKGSITLFDETSWPNSRSQMGFIYEKKTDLWQFVQLVDAANAAIGDVVYWKSKKDYTVTPTIGNSSAGEVAGVMELISSAANNYVAIRQRGYMNVKANGAFARGYPVWADSGNNRVVPGGVGAGSLSAAADTAGAILSVANPLTGPWLVTSLIVDRTTKSTGAGTADFGIAANGTTLNDGLIDGLDLNAAAAITNNFIGGGTNGKAAQYGAAGTYLTGSTASGNVAGLVGTYQFTFRPTGGALPETRILGYAQGAISAGKVYVNLEIDPA